MKRIKTFLVVALAIQFSCFADVTKLPAEHRKILEDTSRFHEILSTATLPPAIVKLCAGDDGKIAEPGQKWQATDVIMEPSLPIRRLIWAATNGQYYILHYERGGIAHSFHIVIATLPKGAAKPTEIWAANTKPNEFKDYAAFVAALRAGRVG